jgi:hypothetical protein
LPAEFRPSGFIAGVASYSEETGKPYEICFKDSTQVRSSGFWRGSRCTKRGRGDKAGV